MIRRNIQDTVQRALADTPVVLINGARQTGKTTLARSIATRSGARYLTFDDSGTLAAASSDPAGFLRALNGPVILDEIQKVPALFPAIKLVVDQDRRPGRFLLTGSANVMTLPRLAESLVGRMEILPLYPFSAGELNEVFEGFVHRLYLGAFDPPDLSRTGIPLAARLARGGFPEAVRRENEDRRAAWFASYLSTILQRDVRDLSRVDALHSLPNLLKLLAARTSGLLNMADVGRDAGLPHTTLTRYLALLETVYLIHRLPAWSGNLGKRLVKAPKLHLVDTGLACHLIGADAARFSRDNPLLGRVLESFVVGELRKQISWTDPRISLYHFRTTVGEEVDVILEKPDGSVAALEVKAGATVKTPDFSALRKLRDHLGPRFIAGVVLYQGDQFLPFGDRLRLSPLEALWAP